MTMITVFQVFYKVKEDNYEYYYGQYPDMKEAEKAFNDISKVIGETKIDEIFVKEIKVQAKFNAWCIKLNELYLVDAIHQEDAEGKYLDLYFKENKEDAWILTVKQEAENIASKYNLNAVGFFIPDHEEITTPDDNGGNDAIFVEDVPVTIPSFDDDIPLTDLVERDGVVFVDDMTDKQKNELKGLLDNEDL